MRSFDFNRLPRDVFGLKRSEDGTYSGFWYPLFGLVGALLLMAIAVVGAVLNA